MSNLIQRHPFHLVDSSPWPFAAGISALATTSGAVMYMHCYQGGGYVASLGFLSLVLVAFTWWRDVVRESTFQGHHTKAVQKGQTRYIPSQAMRHRHKQWNTFSGGKTATEGAAGTALP